MKRIVLALAVIVAALGLVACGGGGSSTRGSTSASGIEPASERLEHTEEGCKFSEEEASAHPSEPSWKTTLAKCRADERELRQMVEAGEGESTAPLPDVDAADDTATGAVQETEERCRFAGEELRANPSEAAAWKATLEGCREELKDAEEPRRVALEEKKNEVRLREERSAYHEERKANREEREAHIQAAIQREDRKIGRSEEAEAKALRNLCSISVREVVAAEKESGDYFREYWRECR